MIRKKQRTKAARNMKSSDPVKRSLAASVMEARKEQKRKKACRAARKRTGRG